MEFNSCFHNVCPYKTGLPQRQPCFVIGVLGVSPFAYAPYAFYNLILPVLTILTVLFFHRKDFSSASARIS